MRIGLYQHHPEFGAPARNTARAGEALGAVDADLVVLPELFNTGYQFVSEEEVRSLAEEIPGGETCRAMQALAEARGMTLVFGMAEKAGGRVYNSAAVMGPEGFVGRYRKVHLFSEEKRFFSSGDTPFPVFRIRKAAIGVMICFDWMFPEAARCLALQGAEIICHPANLVLPHCQEAMRTRSLENGVFSVTANRVGTEARGGKAALTFTGRSQILDPSGRPIAALSSGDEGILIADVNPAEARDKTLNPFNDRLADRRPVFYRPLGEPA